MPHPAALPRPGHQHGDRTRPGGGGSGRRGRLGAVDALALMRDGVVVDGHTDVPTRLFHHPADLAEEGAGGHVDLPRLRRGGVSAAVFALYVPPRLGPAEGWEHALALHRRVVEQERPGELVRVLTADGVRRAAAAGAVAVLVGLENGRPLTSERAVAMLEDLGVRTVTLTHNDSHEWCDSSTGERRHGGLSDLGVAIVREMRRRGILVDVSHASDDAVLHALDAVRCPVIASHSSARALCDHPRNLPDSLVLEIARRGGVVMANCAPFFLDARAARVQRRWSEEIARRTADLPADDLEGAARVRTEVVEAHPLPRVGVERYADHLLHLLEVAGEEHVGIGTDFDGIPATPVGFDDVSCMPRLVADLAERGVPPKVLRLVLGENFLRVLAEAERRAH